MTQALKAIDTRYHGKLFRSRLEARWAVFFDGIDQPWLYEEEGFDLGDGVLYLPDFWLPRLKTWVEIKPSKITDWTKADRLARLTGNRVLICQGSIPAYPKGSYWPENELRNEWPEMVFPSGDADLPYHFCRCEHCGEYGIEFDGRSERINCCSENNGHKDYTADEETIVAAYKAAREKRFEHGDTDEWR